MTDLMLKMRDENIQTTKEKEDEEEYYKSQSKPIHVCISKCENSNFLFIEYFFIIQVDTTTDYCVKIL